MSDNVFHDHLDVCRQCRDNPFNLCAIGYAALVAAATKPMANPLASQPRKAKP